MTKPKITIELFQNPRGEWYGDLVDAEGRRQEGTYSGPSMRLALHSISEDLMEGRIAPPGACAQDHRGPYHEGRSYKGQTVELQGWEHDPGEHERTRARITEHREIKRWRGRWVNVCAELIEDGTWDRTVRAIDAGLLAFTWHELAESKVCPNPDCRDGKVCGPLGVIWEACPTCKSSGGEPHCGGASGAEGTRGLKRCPSVPTPPPADTPAPPDSSRGGFTTTPPDTDREHLSPDQRGLSGASSFLRAMAVDLGATVEADCARDGYMFRRGSGNGQRRYFLTGETLEMATTGAIRDMVHAAFQDPDTAPQVERIAEDRVRVTWRGESVKVASNSAASSPGWDAHASNGICAFWDDRGVKVHRSQGVHEKEAITIPVPDWTPHGYHWEGPDKLVIECGCGYRDFWINCPGATYQSLLADPYPCRLCDRLYTVPPRPTAEGVPDA